MINNNIFDETFYQKLNILRTSVRLSKAAAGQSGGRKSRAKGSSVEFSDFREYILGDDIRRIDWNAYGRFDKLFVKLFMEEKEGIFRLYVDGSASMNFGEKSKSVCAQRIAGALSYCILDNADRLMLNSMTAQGNLRSKAVTGRNAFAKTLENLQAVPFAGAVDMLDCIKKSGIKSSGMAVIISDFYTKDLEEILRYLAFSKQEILLIQVLAREEINPELEGTLSLIDSEDQSEVKITADSSVMKAYKNNYNEFITNMDKLSRKYSARYISVCSDENLDEIFYRILSKINM